MRSTLIAAVLLAALLASSAHAKVLYDSGGFEAFNTGSIAGQFGWDQDGYNMTSYDTMVLPNIVDSAPAGHGKAIEFNNTGATESPISINFPDISTTYKYVQATFDFYRDGAGLNNVVDYWPNGNNPWGSWIWDKGDGYAIIAPVSKYDPSTPMPIQQWTNIAVLYDLQNWTASAWVNGTKVADSVFIDSGEFTGWYFNDWHRRNYPAGDNAYIDNFTLIAGDKVSDVPEPSSLALLAGGLLPLLGLRRRK